MTKKDLKNGMIVELRNGTRYLYCEGVMRGLNEWDLISNYTDNLKCPEFPPLDIVKVYEDTKEYNLSTIFEYKYLKLFWKRPETPKLSEREIEVLKALDVFGYKYIARDSSSSIFAHYVKPKKLIENNVYLWVNGSGYFRIENNLFTFMTWADEKPTSIQELLSDFEKGGEFYNIPKSFVFLDELSALDTNHTKMLLNSGLQIIATRPSDSDVIEEIEIK